MAVIDSTAAFDAPYGDQPGSRIIRGLEDTLTNRPLPRFSISGMANRDM